MKTQIQNPISNPNQIILKRKPLIEIRNPKNVKVENNRIIVTNGVIRVKVVFGIRELIMVYGANEEIDISRFVRYIIREISKEYHVKEKTIRENMKVVIE